MATGKNEAKRVIVVLSVGRSGTSLLMQVLGALGMRLSDNLIGPHHENPDGFFEDADIVNLHKQLLADLGAKPILPLPDGWRESEVVASYRPRMRSLVEGQLAKTDTVWGFKDPRTCALLPLWVDVLKSARAIPTFVLAVREPSAAVRSIIKQAKIPGVMAELVWLSRTCDALFNAAADCCIVHYEDWFSDPTRVAGELLRHTSLDRYFQGNVEAALGDIIKPNLNRAIHDEYHVTNPYVSRLYDVLKECRGTNFDRVHLMQVVRECRAAMDNFKGWYMEAQKVTTLPDADVAQAKKRLERKLAEVEQLSGTVKELTMELGKHKQQESQKDAQLEQLASKVKKLNTEREVEKSQHSEILSQKDMQLEQLTSKVKKLNAEREAEKSQHSEILSQKAMQVEQLTSKVKKLNAEREAEKSQHSEVLSQKETQLEQLASKVKKLNTEYEVEVAKHTQLVFAIESKVEKQLLDLEKLTLQNCAYLKQVKELHEKSEGLAIKLQSTIQPVHKVAQAASVNKMSNVALPKVSAKVPPKANPKVAQALHDGNTNKVIAKKQTRQLTVPQESGRQSKLWRKFKSNPRRFFSDSRITFIRPLKYLFKSRS